MSPSPRTRLRQVDGVTLFERRVGEGPPVVVLHGGPGAHHDYLLPGFDRLAVGRELIFYDQRGGGRSPVGREVPVGWQQQVADLEALRAIWALPRLTLLGYSWGALLALLYAGRHPDRVERLALVSPAPAWREARQEFERRLSRRTTTPELQAARLAARESGLRERDRPAYERRLFELSVAGYFHDPRLAKELTPFRVTERTQRAVWQSLGEFDLRPSLRALALPCRILAGDDDPIPVEATRELAACLRAELRVIPNCGHVPQVEAPEEFVRNLDDFLPATGRREAEPSRIRPW
jgi:proline iminopeptidase